MTLKEWLVIITLTLVFVLVFAARARAIDSIWQGCPMGTYACTNLEAGAMDRLQFKGDYGTLDPPAYTANDYLDDSNFGIDFSPSANVACSAVGCNLSFMQLDGHYKFGPVDPEFIGVYADYAALAPYMSAVKAGPRIESADGPAEKGIFGGFFNLFWAAPKRLVTKAGSSTLSIGTAVLDQSVLQFDAAPSVAPQPTHTSFFDQSLTKLTLNATANVASIKSFVSSPRVQEVVANTGGNNGLVVAERVGLHVYDVDKVLPGDPPITTNPTITANYGIKIEAQTSGGTNYGIWNNAYLNQLDDAYFQDPAHFNDPAYFNDKLNVDSEHGIFLKKAGTAADPGTGYVKLYAKNGQDDVYIFANGGAEKKVLTSTGDNSLSGSTVVSGTVNLSSGITVSDQVTLTNTAKLVTSPAVQDITSGGTTQVVSGVSIWAQTNNQLVASAPIVSISAGTEVAGTTHLFIQGPSFTSCPIATSPAPQEGQCVKYISTEATYKLVFPTQPSGSPCIVSDGSYFGAMILEPGRGVEFCYVSSKWRVMGK